MRALPNLSGLSLGEATGDFYPLRPDEAEALEALGDGGRDPNTLEHLPADAMRDDDNATFRLPLPESAPRNANGSYKYRVYDAAALWEWVRRPGKANDPIDRTPLLKRDWILLRNRYSTRRAHPTPPNSVFRPPIMARPYDPLPPLTDANIRQIVGETLYDARENDDPLYRHERYGAIAKWDVSRVTNMAGLFQYSEGEVGFLDFNGDLSNWDVSSVTTMREMFSGCNEFDCDLGRWKVGTVTDMSGMFEGVLHFAGFEATTKFEGKGLANWDVSNVVNMKGMFSNATGLGGGLGDVDLSSWDVRRVTNMASMFEYTTSFGDFDSLAGWDVSSVTNMRRMFQDTGISDTNLGEWNVSNVTDMTEMFDTCWDFRGYGIDNWNASSVTSVYNMFNRTKVSTDQNSWYVATARRAGDRAAIATAERAERAAAYAAAGDDSSSDDEVPPAQYALPREAFRVSG